MPPKPPPPASLSSSSSSIKMEASPTRPKRTNRNTPQTPASSLSLSEPIITTSSVSNDVDLLQKKKMAAVAWLGFTPSSAIPPHVSSSINNPSSLLSTGPIAKTGAAWGQVRATPFGACLTTTTTTNASSSSSTSSTPANAAAINTDHSVSAASASSDFHNWRAEHFTPIDFPTEGFGIVHGPDVIQSVDGIEHGYPKRPTVPPGTPSPQQTYTTASHSNSNSNPPTISVTTIHDEDDTTTTTTTTTTQQQQQQQQQQSFRFHHDFGSTKTRLDAPIGSLQDKWRLIPHFLHMRSLLRQHIDSFDDFVSHEMQAIVVHSSANEIRSDHDPKFYLRYTDCWIGEPRVEEDSYASTAATPFQCRLRDCTYSAPIYVSVRYTRGRQIVVKRNVIIGHMPIMLRSSKCLLRDKTHDQLMAMKECPHDPGGYFIIKGVEKVILIQEQLSKNRVILEKEVKSKDDIIVTASITSSTHERKSKSYIVMKHGKVYLKNNVLEQDIPISIAFKAMGMESDLEMVQLVGSDDEEVMNALALSLEEPAKFGIYTQAQALKFIGTKVRGRSTMNSTIGVTDGVPAVGGGGAGNAGGGAMGGGGGGFRGIRHPPTPEEEARDVLANVVLSHVPVHKFDFTLKCMYIGHITRRVLLVHLGKMPVDDKDYYGNKRLELAGNLLSLLFEDLFKIFNKDLRRQADMVLSKPNRAQAFDVVKTIRPDTITNGMINAIATGNWVLKRFRMDRAGVTQVLSRLSYMSALGMMTRINSQFEKTRKVSGPRSLQASQWGMLCPSDTPEGEACGLVKNLALLAHITTDDDTQPIERLCRDLGVEDVQRLSGHEIHAPRAFLVLLNGNILGVHTRPEELVENLRSMRRRGLAGEFVSVYLHQGQRAVHIATDGGRVCRPLIIVDADTGKPKLKQMHIEALALGTIDIRDLLKQGIVEYVDCNEENNTLIAVTERDLEAALSQPSQKMKFSHLEVDPFTILGVVGGVIPYPHHNQSPRNTYTVAMSKQAMGSVGLNEYERMDGLLYTLVYPHKPMVKSRVLDVVEFDSIPGGHNSCIAVMSYSGYDIEDAVILNKAAIDRGFGRCMVLKKHQTSVRRYANGTMDRTCGPPSSSGFTEGDQDKRYLKYQAIDLDGICRVGEMLENGSVMVNKESPTDTTTNMAGADFGFNTGMALNSIQYKPSGMSYRSGAPSYVDKVIITSNQHEQFLIKVMLRQVRRPEIGDKFASRHGQKGVCGLIVPQEDMPFNEYGHCPDLIMNPHGFPSRMTVGKLLELLVGKAGLLEGRQGYSSAFGEEFGSADTAEAASEALLRNGFNYSGKDIFYSGTSGEPLDAYIFSGPVFYQKLKHMVLDKAHARARGPRAVLTRQPTEGRSRDGGLRLGEMERDCLIAYGASNLIMERLMHSSDAFSANVCMTCGLLQYQNWCQYCRSGEKVADIRLPYACKLLFQELQSMNVLPRLRLKEV